MRTIPSWVITDSVDDVDGEEAFAHLLTP